MKIFGERLRELRKEFGLTAEQLAQIVDVKRRALVNYESGDREPNIDQLVKLADHFNVSIDYLVGRTAVDPWKVVSKMREIRVQLEENPSVRNFNLCRDFDTPTTIRDLFQQIAFEFHSGDERIRSDVNSIPSLRFSLAIENFDKWIGIQPLDDDYSVSFRTLDSEGRAWTTIECMWPNEWIIARDVIFQVLFQWYGDVLKDSRQEL